MFRNFFKRSTPLDVPASTAVKAVPNAQGRTITAPESNETKQVDVAELWEVRWYSRYSEYSSGISPEVEVFLNEKDARDFVTALKNAFKLIRHTSGTWVSITKK